MNIKKVIILSIVCSLTLLFGFNSKAYAATKTVTVSIYSDGPDILYLNNNIFSVYHNGYARSPWAISINGIGIPMSTECRDYACWPVSGFNLASIGINTVGLTATSYRWLNWYDSHWVSSLASPANGYSTVWYAWDYICCAHWYTLEITFCTPECTNKCGGVPDTCNGTCNAACPAPAQINGNFRENLSGGSTSCTNDYSYSSITPFKDYITLTNPANKTLSCTSNATTYSCSTTFSTLDDPVANYKISQNSAGYNTYWDCPGATSTKSVAAGQTISNNVFFQPQTSWIKLKNQNLNTSLTDIIIPNNVSAYDSDDDGTKKVIIGDAGIISTKTSNAITNPVATYSDNNFVIKNYAFTKMFADFSSVDVLLRNKSKFKVINSVDEITANYPAYNVFSLKSNLTIGASNYDIFKNKTLALLVDGKINFALSPENKFTPDNSSIMLISKSLDFFNTANSDPIKEARGIFISETINTGVSGTEGLKILGNLIALGNSGTLTNSRIAGTLDKPGLFIVLDPSQYLGLLNVLDIYKTYDWREYK